MTSFSTRLSETTYQGKDGTTLFVFSQADRYPLPGDDTRRRYKVGRSMPDGDIDYVGDDTPESIAGFKFKTLAQAQSFAAYLSGEESGKGN